MIANQIGYVAVFSLNCQSQVNTIPLFAEVNGQIQPIFRVKEDYQFSWTENKAKSGNREIRVFDEEQYAQWRKQQRAGETPSVKPLATVQVKYNYNYAGNFFVSSEIFVLGLSIFAAYIAVQNRMKLVN